MKFNGKNSISSDLLIVLIWIIETFIFIVVPGLENTIARTALGIPFVLFIPGYVLIGALFPKKDDLDGIERIALSFGLSIATVPLIGLGLNYTFGIRLIPILVSLCVYSIGLIIIAEYRRRQLSDDDRFKVPFRKIYQDIITEVKTPRSKIDNILSVILIISIILAIGALIYVITAPKIGERFTEFYILNNMTGKADNYPKELKKDDNVTLLVGVVNHEYSDINYTLQIELDKDKLITDQLRLGHNQTWENNVTFMVSKQGTDMKLELLLFKEYNFTEPYRDLHLWVNVT